MVRPIDANALITKFSLPEEQQKSLAGKFYGMVIKTINDSPSIDPDAEKGLTMRKLAQLSEMLDKLYKEGKVESKAYIQLSAAITSIACQS